MEIRNENPPNFQEIKAVLPASEDNIFTYGSTLYVPSGREVPPDILEHEKVHSKQQKNPAVWWDKYLKDLAFRLEEELVAYKAQYAFAKEKHGSSAAKLALEEFARNLSTLYALNLTYHQAHTLIRK